MDRISELPDSLITHILSLLTDTKAVVRTSVLSTRWKNQWTFVPILRFYDDGYPDGVDRVFSCLDSTLNIRELTFYFTYDSNLEGIDDAFSCIYGWICAAIWRNVVELDLCIADMEDMELPQSLFTCKTLKVLSLSGDFIVNSPTTGCFPTLKVLVLEYTYFNADNTRLISNLPVLEDLTIEANLIYGEVCDINISAPEMKRLDILLRLEHDELDLNVYNVYIHAPKLEYFDLYYNNMRAFLFHLNANSHFKADIILAPKKQQYENGIDILKTISRVKHLFLDANYLFDIVFPADFVNLTHLELLRAPYLIEFLKISPNLECLVIDNHTCYAAFDPPEFIPVCMLSHLKTITIKTFTGMQNEMMEAKYFLKYSEVLNKMNINIMTSCIIPIEEAALCKEILMFERGSRNCQVEII